VNAVVKQFNVTQYKKNEKKTAAYNITAGLGTKLSIHTGWLIRMETVDCERLVGLLFVREIGPG